VTTGKLFVAALAGWLAIGAVMAVLMGRRGHAPYSWGLLGLVLGPLAIPLAIQAVAWERPTLARRLQTGAIGDGAVDVLVGVDGSPEGDAALGEVIRLLGPRIGRLSLATVLDFDVAEAGFSKALHDQAVAALQDRADAVVAVTGREPETTLLGGRPAAALAHHAVEGGYHLLALGARGAGRSHALLGSVARELACGIGVPVLTVAEPTHDRAARNENEEVEDVARS